ncbi:hypothetical protein ACW95P_02505 [Candidatus Mycoplasma pogonae]
MLDLTLKNESQFQEIKVVQKREYNPYYDNDVTGWKTNNDNWIKRYFLIVDFFKKQWFKKTFCTNPRSIKVNLYLSWWHSNYWIYSRRITV